MPSKFGTIITVSAGLLLVFGFFLLQTERMFSFSSEKIVATPSKKSDETALESLNHKEVAPVTILFGGDMMFDRYLRTLARKRPPDFFFEALLPTFEAADSVVANLEGPITDNPSISETSVIGSRENYVFTFDPSIASLLKRTHIGVVNIGNNHILNFKEDGVTQTKKYLVEAGVEFFGSPLASDERILVKAMKGVKIALVNYNEFVWQGKAKALEDIAKAQAEADVVVLYAHWGKEYVSTLPVIKNLAHQFVDAGADVIIGSHPHVVQEKEVYAGKTIYYSLGNLFFDQYQETATTHGLLVRMTVSPESRELSFEDIPVTLKSTGQTMLDK